MPNALKLLFEKLAALPRPGRPLTSEGQMTKWVVAARKEVNKDGTIKIDDARLGWLVASAVVVSVLQRVRQDNGDALFLLKGGSYLQYRLGLSTRSTKDVDGLIRGELDSFLAQLDDALRDPWGEVTFRRTEVEVIDVPGKLIQPRRFDVKLLIRGEVWRSIQIELSPDEADIGIESEKLPAPKLHGFALPDPDQLFGISLRSQIAQKLHAVTDPHQPPEYRNDRARDLADLVLLRDTAAAEGTPTLDEIRDTVVKVFRDRAAEAVAAERTPRTWPPTVVRYDHWEKDHAKAASECGLTMTLDEAVVTINAWIAQIDKATSRVGSPA